MTATARVICIVAMGATVCVLGFYRRRAENVNSSTSFAMESSASFTGGASTLPTPAMHSARMQTNPQESEINHKQHPQPTEAEHSLQRMLRGDDRVIDLALANWLVGADVPQVTEVSRESYFKKLDALVEAVRQDMARMEKNGRPGAEPNVRLGRFCNAILKLGFAYREEFREENLASAQMQALYNDGDNLFLAGLLRTGRGTCVTMPMIYLVIGQRLGFPVHLVTVGKHYFIRWEEPGYRMNIEPTIVERVAVTPDDSVYLDIEGINRDQLRGSQMLNLNNREVVGELLYARSAYWATKGPAFRAQQLHDLSLAQRLAPDDPDINATWQALFGTENRKPQQATKIKPDREKGRSI